MKSRPRFNNSSSPICHLGASTKLCEKLFHICRVLKLFFFSPFWVHTRRTRLSTALTDGRKAGRKLQFGKLQKNKMRTHIGEA